jgi:hypothetical protein
MHNNVCLDFDGGSSSKARLGTRITKVGQTNIDEFLLDFFWRRVNFLHSPPPDPAPKPGRRRCKKIARCREPFWHPRILEIVSSSREQS